MNVFLTMPEIAVVGAGLSLLLLDLWTPAAQKRSLGYVAIALVGLVLGGTFLFDTTVPAYAFGQMYVLDGLALFLKRFFLLAALIVLVMAMEYADCFEAGVVEYYALILFALSGMMWAASANDFSLLFVSLELITVSFYVLSSFQRHRSLALEAGVKYLILGALASAFLVFGIALVFGSGGTLAFASVAAAAKANHLQPLFRLGLVLVLVGLGFKIAAFPLQIWAPDVYQGAPTPTVAFLATGSKAAGFVLLLRVLYSVAPETMARGRSLLMLVSALTMLYGALCAIPQRNLKRLLGYSSIANAGYLLLGVAAGSASGAAAILYYLAGYLFTLLAAFTVICVVLRKLEAEDIQALAGLHQRSPFLAATLALAMISLAGIPPLAGFFGKFLLLNAILERAGSEPGFYWLAAGALLSILISLYYYFGVVRAIYWSKPATDAPPIQVPPPLKLSLTLCLAAMFYLGLLPGAPLGWATQAAAALHLN